MNFVFLENWTFCCPVLGSRHCTRPHAEIVDPACRPSIPLYSSGTGTVLYAVRQGSVRFNTERRCISYLPFTILLYIIYLCSRGSIVKAYKKQPIFSKTHGPFKPLLIFSRGSVPPTRQQPTTPSSTPSGWSPTARWPPSPSSPCTSPTSSSSPPWH